jgi:hypothetical protein
MINNYARCWPEIKSRISIKKEHSKRILSSTNKLNLRVKLENFYICNIALHLDDWLTVPYSITLVELQLDAQNSCLFTYNTFINVLYVNKQEFCASSRSSTKVIALYGTKT